MNKYSVSASGIVEYLWDVRKCAWNISNDMRTGDNAVDKIEWYIHTGRAGSEFIRSMIKHRPTTIAKLCLLNGSDDDVLSTIKAYLKIA